jgi:hypothetical protein
MQRDSSNDDLDYLYDENDPNRPKPNGDRSQYYASGDGHGGASRVRPRNRSGTTGPSTGGIANSIAMRGCRAG